MARWSLGLWLALVLYALLAMSTGRAVGLVGEVDIGWALPEPPTVLASWDQPAEVSRLGPLEARATRPLEGIRLGATYWPLAVNSYTGGAADWPARVATLVGGRAAGVATHVALGALLLVLAHRFLRFHGTATSAGAVALLLATDWCFVFFKRVLGGTEILLQAAGLLVLWSLWSRRWKGGRHGTIALALGVGLGLGAKITFVATLVAFAVAALATRWDRPNLRPPEPVRWWVLAVLPALCVAPLVVASAHHAALSMPVPSHDTLALQAKRLALGATLGREALANLGRFLGNPLDWLADAWGTVPTGAFDLMRALGLAVVALGTFIEWRGPTRSPSAALLRFLSIFVPIQLALLFLANRDLHHLAQATVPLACWGALGADRVAATLYPPRSILRAVATAIFIAPLCWAGATQLRATDAVVGTARSALFRTSGQAALFDLCRDHDVRRLVTTSYELYGLIEQGCPGVEVVHGWGAVARKEKDLDALRRVASGGHYLVVKGSAPFVYDWRPEGLGEPVAALSDGRVVWAELYRIE
ncbi:MAG: hypothetical protein FJ102_25110 [Deltaproteobacteria bacterium]|nr:hypothetical protein [Deltaproteobacteria bacterium]